MPEYVFSPPEIPALPVLGIDRLFPVRRIYAVGRNYAEHAIEMGHDPDREAPFFFQKSPGNLLPENRPFPYPPLSGCVHHEIELVVALSGGGTDIPVERALDCVYGYAVGLDMTRRDLQGEAKQAGRPWDAGKAFEHSAPCSRIVPASHCGHPASGEIILKINGTTRQRGNLDQMIHTVPEIISCLSRLFELGAGDLLMTGTPAGVGPVERRDRLEGCIEGVGELVVTVA